MVNNQLLNFFDNLVKSNELEIEKQHEYIFGPLEQLSHDINIIIENPTKIMELDLQAISKDLSISDEVMKNLKFYQTSARSTIFPLVEAQKANIVTIFREFKTKIEKNIAELMDGHVEYQLLKNNHQNILELFQKLNSNDILTKEEFVKISTIIRENSSNISESLTILKNLALSVTLQYEKESNLEKESIVKINNLNKEDVINLFLEYDLDFDQFKERDRDQLLLYGSLDNIRNILTVFKENHIHLNISSYSKKLSQILILSNEKNINIIFGKIKEDLGSLANDLYHFNKMFEIYMDIPSVFVSGIKRYERQVNKRAKNNKTSPSGNSTNDFFSGALNNYLLNRQLFIDLGITDINKAIEKCSSIFTASHRKVKTNLEYFKSYGITSSVYLNTLSSMRATNPLDIIDQFIEADAYDYIINCFSKTNMPLNSSSLYQLINAKKKGWNDTEIYRYIKLGNKRQKQLRATNLSKLSGKELENEPQYKIEVNSDYDNIDFSNQEPITDIILNNYFIRNLENNFKHDELTYNFNGIIISRYKVLRYYAILLHNHMGDFDSLKYAIFQNTIITKSEYDMVIDCLNKIFKEKNDEEIPLVNTETNLNQVSKSSNLNDSSNKFLDKGKFTEVLLNNFFIKFLDENFIKDNWTYDYNFNGISISRHWTIRYFGELLSNGEVMPNPLEAIFKAIVLSFKARKPDDNLTSEQCEIIKNCLNEASKDIKDMGRRL